MSRISVRRVYEAAAPGDGFRILVDRLWPRGLTHEEANVDLWLKDLAPSNELRHAFGHDPARWEAFRKGYFEELEANEPAVAPLRAALKAHPVVTLVFGAKEERFNNAVALEEFIKHKKIH